MGKEGSLEEGQLDLSVQCTAMALIETPAGAEIRGSGPIFRDAADGSAPSTLEQVALPVSAWQESDDLWRLSYQLQIRSEPKLLSRVLPYS